MDPEEKEDSAEKKAESPKTETPLTDEEKARAAASAEQWSHVGEEE